MTKDELDQTARGYFERCIELPAMNFSVASDGGPGGVPRELWVGEPDADGWVEWHLVPSTITDADLDDLETELDVPFGPAHRSLLQAYFHSHVECGVRLGPLYPKSWRDQITKANRGWDAYERGLVVVADERYADAGPICFDITRRHPDGDCPVVLFDHEWIGTAEERRDLFSSGAAMLRCLRFLAGLGFDPIRDNGRDPEQTARKREALSTFFALDPQGAGGPGRSWWTSWGVDPS